MLTRETLLERGAGTVNELVAIENINAIELYRNGGLEEVINKIEIEIKSLVPDISTVAGRKAIASNAYKGVRSRTILDNAGKELNEERNKLTALVNKSRKSMRERLTAITDEARKPLTEWEEADKKRLKNLEDAIQDMQEVGLFSADQWMFLSIDEMGRKIVEVDTIYGAWTWGEFAAKAKMAKEQAIINIKHGISERKARDKAEAERIEAEKKAQAEREAQIAKEAAERATREAEEKADKARLKAEQEEKEHIAKIESDKQSAIQATKDAQSKLERERNEAAEAMKSAQEKAEREKDAAIQAERNRKAAENAALKEKERLAKEKVDKKAANKAHQGKINREALNSAVKSGFTPDEAKAFIEAVVKGEIYHVTINY